MPADASIYQQFLQPPKSVMDYQAQYDQADARKNALQQSVLALQKGQMDMANAADVSRQRNALRDAVTSGQIDLSNPDHAPRALAIAPDVAPAMLKTVQEGATSRAKAGLDNAQAGKTTQETQIAGHAQHLQALSTVNDPQAAVQWITDGVRSGALPAAGLQQALDRLQQSSATPEGFAQWKQQTQAMGLTVQQQMEQTTAKPTEVRLGNVVKTIDMNPRSQTFGKEVVGQQAIGVSPDTAANNVTHLQGINIQQAGENRRSANTIAKDFTIAGVKPDGTPMDGGGLLSPESVINAATRYNMDGTLPPNLGRGTQGPRQTAQILNEAARQAAARGDSPEAQRIAQLANKANAAAMGTIEKQATMVGAFEKNFSKNADIALELSQKVDRTGVPIVNSWINAGRRAVTGNPDLAAFDANIKATVNEYAKIVGGGSGSGATAQGEISKIEGLLSTAQTPEQVASVISLMKRETANRLQAFEEQKAELRQSMIRPGSAKPAPATPAATATAVPPDIANILKKHGGK